MNRRNPLFAVFALVALTGAILVAAPVAGAQQAAGTDQYDPGGGGGGGGNEGAGGGGGGGGDQAPAGGGGGGASAAETDAGDLPFTGYPLTPLVLAVVLLVIAGLAFRAFSETRQRLRTSQAASGR